MGSLNPRIFCVNSAGSGFEKHYFKIGSNFHIKSSAIYKKAQEIVTVWSAVADWSDGFLADHEHLQEFLIKKFVKMINAT